MPSEWYGSLQLFAPHGRLSEIPTGRGVFKVKILEATHEAKLEFPGGTGGANKKPSMGGGVWIFSGTTQCTLVGQTTTEGVRGKKP